MFSKNEKLESFIGRNTHFKGDISTKGTLRVDGRVTGNVEADWFVLGEKSFLKGNARVGGIEVGGTVEGDIEAKEVVEIKHKGQVKGNVVARRLLVVEGGFIQGKIAMFREGGKVVEFSSDKVKETGSQ
jgi:cytoskeletal protein CcmA (bactofilin family)